MSKPLRALLCGVVSLVMMIFCCACAQNDVKVIFETDAAPDEIKGVITDYFSKAKGSDVEKVLKVLYFEDDFDREAYCRSFESGIKPTEATVISVDKINDQLYAATIDVKATGSEIQSGEVYNFIARIGGSWRYILAKSNIPESVLAGADLSAYSYIEKNVLDSSDIIK